MSRHNGRRGRQAAKFRPRVLEYHGPYCLNCGDPNVEADHIWPRSQGGPYNVLNGAPLCGPWSNLSPFPNGCHKAKTDGLLQYKPEWVTEEQRAWLAEVGWVDWDDDGLPFGRGYKHFTGWGARREEVGP